MNYAGICITLLLTLSVSLTVMIHNKRKQETYLAKQTNFEEIKTTVTRDILAENLEAVTKAESQLGEMKKELVEQREKRMTLQTEANHLDEEKEQCYEEAKQAADTLGALEAEKGIASKQFEKEKEEWSKTIASLKEEASQRSKVCGYIMKTSEDGRKLCGIPAEAAAEPKQEEPKAGDTEKAAAEPKQEEPKAGDT
ncbi:hypothetical protein AALO_G00172630 [Alosa alosa]|uniref:Uncharacterized protein n=1 Tax=Alosa alosa TaxID=278164 RepID=A0AAV6GBA0_9TELE|nr:uncharacterized protein zgc:174935 [Alosa alosa]KAG5270816.1 hypothetical protein AALO_G00172630 [Alosa alosa]